MVRLLSLAAAVARGGCSGCGEISLAGDAQGGDDPVMEANVSTPDLVTDTGIEDVTGDDPVPDEVEVDPGTWARNCGHCDTACLFDEQCDTSICQVMAWSVVGRAVNMGLPAATAHALSNDGATPHVAMVLTDSWAGDVWVRRFEPLPAGWTDVGPTLVPGLEDATAVVDIEFAGAVPYVVHHNGTLARVRYHDGAIWDEVGAPGFTTMCMALEGLRLVLDGTDPHLTYMGAGGCGIGVGYFWHDAGGWHHHPSTTGFPGTELVTMDGNGVSDVVFTDRAHVATGDVQTHRVKIWDATGSDWIDLGSPLEMNADSGWGEDQSMAADAAGNLCVAWSEQDGAGVGSIYVKAHTTDWTLLGAGAASGGGNASRPTVTIIDGVPWIAYQEDDGTSEKIMVRRWSGTEWERVGLPLNMSAAEDGLWPDIDSIASVPYVAFRESDGTAQRVYVKTFP